MATTAGRVLSVNVGTARSFEYNGHPAKSAIWKSPVAGRIAARGVNLDGDDQADRPKTCDGGSGSSADRLHKASLAKTSRPEGST